MIIASRNRQRQPLDAGDGVLFREEWQVDFGKGRRHETRDPVVTHQQLSRTGHAADLQLIGLFVAELGAYGHAGITTTQREQRAIRLYHQLTQILRAVVDLGEAVVDLGQHARIIVTRLAERVERGCQGRTIGQSLRRDQIDFGLRVEIVGLGIVGHDVEQPAAAQLHISAQRDGHDFRFLRVHRIGEQAFAVAHYAHRLARCQPHTRRQQQIGIVLRHGEVEVARVGHARGFKFGVIGLPPQGDRVVQFLPGCRQQRIALRFRHHFLRQRIFAFVAVGAAGGE